MKNTISPKLSLEGWSLNKFLKGNKEFIKTILALGIGASGILVTGGLIESGVSAIIFKFAVDILDYYITDVKN